MVNITITIFLYGKNTLPIIYQYNMICNIGNNNNTIITIIIAKLIYAYIIS